MTVIATDGRSIAADTLMCLGSERQLGYQKIRQATSRAGVRAVIAVSGTAGVAEALRVWWEHGAVPQEAPKLGGDLTWQLLVITAAGIWFYSDRVPYPLAVAPPFCVGSGADYAMGAIKHGASPHRAVQITCELDVHCGGEIQVVNIAEALGVSPVREAAE